MQYRLANIAAANTFLTFKLADHLHPIWQLSEDNINFSLRSSLIKMGECWADKALAQPTVLHKPPTHILIKCNELKQNSSKN